MSDRPLVVRSVAGLDASQGRLAVCVGVFDGLHLGHAHLLAALTTEAQRWGARPAVITFDAHPDAVLHGEAPPLLLDPAERLDRLAGAGVEVIVIEHFDDRLRTTAYDEFVRGIAARVDLAGFVMATDASFGHERRGTPEALRVLGATSRPGFEVSVVAPFSVDGRPVSSSEIRRLVAAGDLAGARRLLGRPYAVVAEGVDGSGTLAFGLPVALPPAGDYEVSVESASGRLRIRPDGEALLEARTAPPGGPVRVVFTSGPASRGSSPASVGRKPQRS